MRSHRRSYALILLAQRPPGFVVIRRLHLSGKNFPAPLVDHQPERQKCDLIQRRAQQQRQIGARRRNRLDQADLLQIFRRDGERDRIADRLMEAVVRAIAEQERLLAVRQ